MTEPACLALAKKIVRLLARHEGVAFMEKKRALAIAGALHESGHYAPGSAEFSMMPEEETQP